MATAGDKFAEAGRIISTGGFSRLKGIKARRAERKEKRQAKHDRGEARKNDNLALGGSVEEEKRLFAESQANSQESRDYKKEAFEQSRAELDRTHGAQERAEADYNQDRNVSAYRAADAYGAIDNIGKAAKSGSDIIGRAGTAAADEYTKGAQQGIDQRNNALATNALTGSAESILARRESALAGAPSISGMTEDNILANQANAAANQNRSTQMLNRQAMGLAAGQGEGGALAMQQAMASAGAAGGDLAAQQNQQLAEQVAQQRYAAAMATRGETVDSANLGLQTRMGATEAERKYQMGVAGENAMSLEGAAGNRAKTGLGVADAQSSIGIKAALDDQTARAAGATLAQTRAGQSAQSNLQLQAQGANLATGNATLAQGANASDQGYQADIMTAKYGAQKDREENQERTLAQKVLMPFNILGK